MRSRLAQTGPCGDGAAARVLDHPSAAGGRGGGASLVTGSPPRRSRGGSAARCPRSTARWARSSRRATSCGCTTCTATGWATASPSCTAASPTRCARQPALRSALREVHTSAGAAAYLAVFRDVDVVVAYVDDCADHPRPDALHVGEPTPAHATAAGKVMLAGLRPARLSELLERTGLPRLAPRTVADRRALDRELMRIRSEGAAVEVEEYVPGVAGVAAPVLGADGEVSAALGVSVSRAEFAARRWELERVVRAAASRAVVNEAERARRMRAPARDDTRGVSRAA